MVDLGELDGLDALVHAAQPDDRQVDGRDPAVVEADDELVGRIVDGQRRRPGCRDDADGVARAQVFGPDLVAGREMDPLTGTVAGEDVLPSMLDGGGADRRSDVAGPIDVVTAPQHDPGSHGVLREVRVRPFIDVVRLAVAPILEELGRGAGVIDLVEVHLVGLGQAERAQPERGQQQDDHDPDVEAVEAAAAFPDQGPAPVGADGSLRQPVMDPPDDTALRERGPVAPGREVRRGIGCRPGGARRCKRVVSHVTFARGRHRLRAFGERRARSTGPIPHAAGCHLAGPPLRGGPGLGEPRVLQLVDHPRATVRAHLEQRPHERCRVQQRDDRDGQLGAQERADPEPVTDRIERRIVGRVERGQDHVHVRERGDGQDHVGDPPAWRDREQDRAEREEREAVALVHASRQGEERQGQEAQDDEQGNSIGMAGRHPQQDDEGRDQQRGPHRDRGHDTEHRHARAALADRQGRGVADPLAAAREAVAQVARHDGPGVVRIDRQVRVPATGLDDLVDEPGCEERCLRHRLEHGQAERQAQHDRREEAGDAGREDAQGVVRAGFPRAQPIEEARALGHRAVVVVGRRRLRCRRPQRSPDRHDRQERDQDAELRLHECRDDREDGRSLRLVAPQRP